ncbi:MAG: translocation/assembly module TamB domain-containing protein [Candidatus Neomarinimicrobiota bacterium]
MMDKRKKYILAIVSFAISIIFILSSTVLWDNYVQSLISKKIESYGWNIQVESFSGNFLSTIKMNHIELKNENGSYVNIDKVSVNIGIISSLFNIKVFDLFTVEGMDCKYLNQYDSTLQFEPNKLIGEIPFEIKSFFIDARIKTKIIDEDYDLVLLAGGKFNGMNSPMLDFDLLKVSVNDNINLACIFNRLTLGYDQNFYFLKDLDGEMFGLPINGNISINKIDSTLKGIIDVPKFSFPQELFSKLPLKTKFSTFTGRFEFESDFQYFDGQVLIENEIGLDMQGHFNFGKQDNSWILNRLELIGDNSNLIINGAWENDKRLSCYMNLNNLDLSGWIKNHKPTKMSGLFIVDGGLTDEGALDLIDMTLELVETKYFNKGEISIHGQMTYRDSVLSTTSPVMLFIGDNYITINGKTDFIKQTIDVYTDMENADIDLINSFLPGEFLSGKATGNLKIFGDIVSPSASAELVCENVNINDFDLESIRLNSHLSVIDSIPSGFVDIKADRGKYKNRSFDSGTVSAIIDNKLIKIENCHFKSGKDFLQLSGTYNGDDDAYTIDRIQLAFSDNYLINSRPVNLFIKDSLFNVQPFEFHINDGTMEGLVTGGINPEGRFKMSNFEAGIITQFFDDERLKFSGLIFGEIWISVNENNFDIDTDLSLKKGTYMEEKFDELMISCLYKNGVLHIDDLSMTRKGLMGLQASGIIPIMKSDLNRPPISLNSNFSNLPLEFIHRFIPNFYNLEGYGTGSINIGGILDSTSFQYDLNVKNAKFDIIDLGYFMSKGYYNGEFLKVKEAKSERKDGFIVGSGDLPFDFNLGSKNFGKFFKNKEFAFKTYSKILSLPFLSPYIADLDSAVGDFNIELSLNGVESNIQRNGKIMVSNASLYTLLLSDPITSINGFAIIKDNRLTIDNLEAMIYNSDDKDKRLSSHNTRITGSIDFSKFFNPNYDLLLKADNASYQLLLLDIAGKSNLNLNISGRDTVLIDGMVEMQEGNIFYEFTTEDVGTPIQNRSENLLAYNLNIPIRGKSYFRNSQIDAELTGELNLSQFGNQEVNFGGQIYVEDGSVFSYKDYFERLQGIVSFDKKGFNPYIDVSAYTMIDDERIDLIIKGGIEDLDIILESVSGFSESDILELLTWGKRFEDDSWTSTGFGNQTFSILGTLLENQLEKNLKASNIGMMNYVDDIDISGAAGLFQGTNEDFEVTTKTQISEKTFLNLSYKRSFSLNQDQSKVGVEYKLNRHFSVVGNVDEEGNLNLKYRYRYAY